MVKHFLINAFSRKYATYDRENGRNFKKFLMELTTVIIRDKVTQVTSIFKDEF